jgi:glycine/D-amino acid oxidase-like deaminating enzyme
VTVAGAGIFGAATAYFLRRAGLRVRLLDAWGVAHPRATSAGESRVLRFTYGRQGHYTKWAWEARRQWLLWEQEWNARLFYRTGVLWLADEENDYLTASLVILRENGIPAETWPVQEAIRHFPQFAPLRSQVAIFEPEAGLLLARQACRALVDAFVREGGWFEVAAAPSPETADPPEGTWVYACGPWLPQLFPRLLGGKIRVTRQEEFFFGPPAGSADFEWGRFPAWIDLGPGRDLRDFSYYGLPSLDGRGVKVALDVSGPEFDPTSGDRAVTAEGLAGARRYMAARLPALAGAPLVETRVCQYERTADANLILDRHPEWENVWIAGGGSGHGFKLGPMVGKYMTAKILGTADGADFSDYVSISK